jgi:hypothetical protein
MTGRPPEWYRGLFGELDARVDQMGEADEFDRAVKYANVAKGIATKIGDTSSTQEWTNRAKDLATLKTQYGGYKAAKELIMAGTADAAAFTKWGTYLCLLKGDFDAGLPYLAKGDDAALAALAKRESNPNRDAAETAAIADEWYAVGEKSKLFRGQAWRHALGFYQDARPSLSGLAATKIQKRVEEIAAVSPPRSGNSLQNRLTSGPWVVQWDQGFRRRDHGGEGDQRPEWTREETITFHEGGHVESNYFFRYDIRGDIIELQCHQDEEGGGPPPFAGRGLGQGQRDRRWYGRARLVGNELQFIVFRGDRIDDPRNRGVGTRQE